MPFQSEKQRRYLWANEPEIARDWADTYGSRIESNRGGITRTAFSDGLTKEYQDFENWFNARNKFQNQKSLEELKKDYYRDKEGQKYENRQSYDAAATGGIMRLGYANGPAGGASAGGNYGGNVNPEQTYAGRTYKDQPYAGGTGTSGNGKKDTVEPDIKEGYNWSNIFPGGKPFYGSKSLNYANVFGTMYDPITGLETDDTDDTEETDEKKKAMKDVDFISTEHSPYKKAASSLYDHNQTLLAEAKKLGYRSGGRIGYADGPITDDMGNTFADTQYKDLTEVQFDEKFGGMNYQVTEAQEGTEKGGILDYISNLSPVKGAMNLGKKMFAPQDLTQAQHNMNNQFLTSQGIGFMPNNPYQMVGGPFAGMNAPGTSAFGSKDVDQMATKWLNKYGHTAPTEKVHQMSALAGKDTGNPAQMGMSHPSTKNSYSHADDVGSSFNKGGVAGLWRR